MKSATTSEFLTRLRSMDVKLFAENGRIRFTAPTGSLTPALRAELAARKGELLRFLSEAGLAVQASTQPIPRLRQGVPPPLSSAQMRLWFLDQLEGGIHYNVHFALRLGGRLQVAALERALGEIMRRHEVIRTAFPEVDGQPVQRVVPPSPFSLPVVGLQNLPAPGREDEAMRLAVEDARRPFDLAQGPTWRLTLLALDDDNHILLVTAHHIAMDGWSWGVFLGELRALYQAYADRKPSPLGELPIQYGDYAAWHAEWLKSEGITRQLDYWTRELAGAPGFLELPSDRPRPAVQTFRGAWHPITLPQAATIALKNLGQREGVTLFTALLAVLQALLKRYTGQEHILVGTPVANRPRTELEGLIGCFLNTVVLRGNLSGDPTFRDVLRQGRETVLEALAHQDVPLEKLIDVLRPERNQSYSPLFQVLLVLQNTPMPEVEMGGLTLRPFEVANGTAKFDLMLSLTETTEGLEGWIEYATDLFDADRIRRLAGHFQRMIEEFSANPDLRLSQVSLLTPDERQQLLVDWNRTAVDYPRNSCIHELFEAQAEHTPQATALVCGAERHTYRELNRQANQLAHRLRELGVGPETLVGVCVRRSPEMVVGLLAILKAGGAYVPLDPAYPKERLAFILEDARAPVLLTQRSLCEGFQARNPELRLICLDAHDNLGGQSSMRNTQSRVTSNRLAYVIYTSGSTGKPKGVAIEHRSAVAFIHWANSVFTREELAGVLASTSICFDLSVFELFVPLSRGGTVILADNALQLPGLAVQPEVTLINTVPSAMAELLRIGGVPESVRTVNLAGEPLSGRLVQQIYQLPGIQKVYDLYGPSEDTTYSTFVLRSPNGPVTIGQPISNTQAYVLDNHLQPVPVGVPGELFLSGDGLARGYLNRPELTAEKFVANPFGDGFGARLYKTGDLARYRPDGNIEFLGRRDHQVKIRGFRIELGEVESALNELIAVSESVVVSREDEAGDKRLVAYVVPKQAHTLNVVELRDFLIKKLPDYMLPSAFVFLDKLPLTPNGKVDRKALPKPSRTSPEIGSGPLAPSDVLEQQLVQIWEKVLRVRPVGLRDNFFDLGGHSLIAVRLFSELRKQTGRNFPLATLFQAPTVEQLAEFLRKDGWSPHWSSLVPIQPGGGKPPFFSVHGGGGNVLLFRDLAHRLGSDYPFYGLQSQGLDGKGNYLRSVTEMASHYLDEIRELQPSGPYYLGGFCMGGSVAYEIAQKLLELNQEIRLLVMFDTYNHNGTAPQLSVRNRLRYLRQKVQFHWVNVARLPSKERIAYLGEKLRGASEREIEKISIKLDNLSKLFGSRVGKANIGIVLEDVNDQAGHSYRPKAYPGEISLFVPQRNYAFMSKPRMGWTEFAVGGLNIIELPVYPGGMFIEPYVQTLADKLRVCIDEAQKSHVATSATS